VATTAQLIARALDALKPETGLQKPSPQQIREADARARGATAAALDRIAGALEEIAANTTPAVRPAIRHST
jgi:hypothetical protein